MVSAGIGTIVGAVGKSNLLKVSALEFNWPDFYSIV